MHEGKSEGYVKQAVYGLRYWFRVFGKKEMILRMPPIKKKQTLPEVLSKEECQELFKAPRRLKHRFLLACAYSAGLRMNELRLVRIADVDTHRMQIHVRQGKGKKDRYVILSNIIADKLPTYLNEVKPKVYLFEGLTPGEHFLHFVGGCAAYGSFRVIHFEWNSFTAEKQRNQPIYETTTPFGEVYKVYGLSFSVSLPISPIIVLNVSRI